jgi:hypothetical protein
LIRGVLSLWPFLPCCEISSLRSNIFAFAAWTTKLKGETGRSLLRFFFVFFSVLCAFLRLFCLTTFHQSPITFHVPPPPMSLSRTIFRDVPINTWIDRYETSHQNPVNRAFHTFGIPMIAVSLPLFLLAPLIRGFWKIPLSLFTLGWACQFLGHAVEGKPPEFLKDWRFLFVGLRWWLRTISGPSE